MKKATICISFDVEFEWGRKHLKNYSEFIPRIQKEEQMIEKLLALFKLYNIHVTWAVVGALFDEKKDLINTFLVDRHEVASHSYAHLDYKKATKKEAEKDIQKVVASALKNRIQLTSFVFPFNHINHIDVLRRYGFTTYRDAYTFYFPSTRRWGRCIPKGWRYRLVKIAVDRAVQKGTVFHLWTHPIDFVDNHDMLFSEFTSIINYVSELRKKKVLDIKTMAEIAHDASDSKKNR